MFPYMLSRRIVTTIKTAAMRPTFSPGFGKPREETIARERITIAGRTYQIPGFRKVMITRKIALADVGRPTKDCFCRRREKDERRIMLQTREKTSTMPTRRWTNSSEVIAS